MATRAVPQPYASIDTKIDEADLAAFHALNAGVASEGQQKRVLNVLIYKICETYEMSYRPGEAGDRDTVFAEGKRYVGNAIVRLTKLVKPQK